MVRAGVLQHSYISGRRQDRASEARPCDRGECALGTLLSLAPHVTWRVPKKIGQRVTQVSPVFGLVAEKVGEGEGNTKRRPASIQVCTGLGKRGVTQNGRIPPLKNYFSLRPVPCIHRWRRRASTAWSWIRNGRQIDQCYPGTEWQPTTVTPLARGRRDPVTDLLTPSTDLGLFFSCQTTREKLFLADKARKFIPPFMTEFQLDQRCAQCLDPYDACQRSRPSSVVFIYLLWDGPGGWSKCVKDGAYQRALETLGTDL
ncbi:hypothetical protein HD554DRAFT_2059538 [Boletus coccyginus]|nr:hypothetical protein HD554DRAFT_2059538 [Boletus coccyginus]